MGIEGRERQRELEAGAQVLSGQLGKTIQRLRKAYNLSLSELAEQSGVAKSIISQIERNETNPTLATIWRLRRPSTSRSSACSRRATRSLSSRNPRADTPILVSEDGKVRLAIIGWIKTVEWLQWYDVKAEPGGVLDPTGTSAARSSVSRCSRASSRSRSADVVQRAKAGETLRYRCDRRTPCAASATSPGRATMVCILKAAVMD